MVKDRKWYLCGLLTLTGLVGLFLLPGYQTSGLLFLALASLIPIYHGFGILQLRKPKLGRVTKMIFSTALCLFLLAVAVTLGILFQSSQGTVAPRSDYLVVLGAGVNGTVPSQSLRERLDAAYAYLNEHPDAVAIVSGEDITEAQCMANYLTDAGIDPQRIWLEEQATNTLENLRYSLDLIQTRTDSRAEKIAIVSSEYHLHRAGMFAQKLSVEAELIPAKTEIPPLRWNYFLREVFAVWYYTIFGG